MGKILGGHDPLVEGAKLWEKRGAKISTTLGGWVPKRFAP